MKNQNLGCNLSFPAFLTAMIGLLLLTACSNTVPGDPPPAGEPVQDVANSVPTATATMFSPDKEIPAEPAAASPAATTTKSPSPTSLPTATPVTHIVQASETLSSIAASYGISASALQLANDLDDPNLIFPGQELQIPQADLVEGQDLPTPTPIVSETQISAAPAEVAGEPTKTPPPLSTLTDQSPNNDLPTATATVERAILHNGVLCPDEIPSIPGGAQLVGYSAVCQLPILSYRLGNGDTPLILVAGMHGGYEWNTITLAYNMLDYLRTNPGLIPPSLSIYLIPNGNPDGLYMVAEKTGPVNGSDIIHDTVAGRFNGRKVDLNRNWDCQWSDTAVWRDNPISGGSAPFSEPENQALRQFFLNIRPAAILFWHSAARGVYAAGCGEVDPASRTLAQVYGEASGYPVYDSFQHYDITGDASDWLATQNIPSFTVELSTHELMDWDINLAGLMALFQHVSTES